MLDVGCRSPFSKLDEFTEVWLDWFLGHIFQWRNILLNASQVQAIATLKYSSLVVNDEFNTKTILEYVSQMTILGHQDGGVHIVRS